MDLTTLLGILIGFRAILTSVVIEGGQLYEMLGPPAALIVFGGTIGAALISFPLETVTIIP